MLDSKIKELVNQAFNRSETYFIIEGIDKAGKTTLIKQIKEYAESLNKPVLIKVVKNPTPTQKKELNQIWHVVNNAVTNAVLYSTYIDYNMQQAWQSVDSELAGKENIPIIYLIDRWYLSTLAYQKAQATSREQIWAIEELVDDKANNFLLATFDSLNPDNSVVNIFYLDTSFDIIKERLREEPSLDQFETIDFLAKVKDNYKKELDIYNDSSGDYPHLRIYTLQLKKDKEQTDWLDLVLMDIIRDIINETERWG